jgi:hypothetical protein
MSEAWGGAQGGSQGGREFSPTAFPANLPKMTSDDATQGGKSQDRPERPKPPKTGFLRGIDPAPSLPAEPGTGLDPVSLRVIGAEGQTVAVRVPSGLPVLDPPVCRALLAILAQLTTVEILDDPVGRGTQ